MNKKYQKEIDFYREKGFHIEDKVWGTEIWLTNGEEGQPYCAKKMFVEPGFQCSFHKHPIKTETFIVEGGNGFIKVEDNDQEISKGSKIHIPHNTFHTFGTFDGMTILEVSTIHSNEDTIRRTKSGSIN